MEDKAPNLENPVTALVTLKDFQSFDFCEPIAEIKQVEPRSLQYVFHVAATQAKLNEQNIPLKVLTLVIAICGLGFDIDNNAGPYSSQATKMDGSRTQIPDDFRGEQSAVLFQIASSIKNPGLRARFYDIVWHNNPKETRAAEGAIEAYCDCVSGLLKGIYEEQYPIDLELPYDAIKYFKRALQISRRISKKGHWPAHIEELIGNLHEVALRSEECMTYARVGNILLDWKLLDTLSIATNSERLALSASSLPNSYPIAIKELLHVAARAYHLLKDDAAERRCRLASVDQTLLMQNQCGQSAAKASWIKDAIAELRTISQTSDQQEKLRIEMRRLQEMAQSEFGTFSIPTDYTELRAGTLKIFSDLTLPDALLKFALLTHSPSVENLKAQALEIAKSSALFSAMGAKHLDIEGKHIADSPGLPSHGEPNEEWFKSTISRDLEHHRHAALSGAIDPARLNLNSRINFSERHFHAIADFSPFIPITHTHLFALGFTRFMQGDFMSACYLLIPQVENSLRYVLSNHGIDVSKIKNDMLQEDPSISTIIDLHRAALEDIFGSAILNELELLFVYRPGPALRHEFAHGKITAADCYSLNGIYACWFIYHLCVVPLIPQWKDNIAPLIEQQCF